MKKSFIIIFVFISHLSYSQDRKLSLSECIDLAIENNENLKNSKLEEKISKSLSKEYLSIGFPQINLDGGLKYNPSSNNFEVDGDITAFASDDRLKTNRIGLTGALDKVNSLSGFTYNFNEVAGELGFNTEIDYVGVSAQEVEKVLPEAVRPAPINNDYITVQYEKLVPLLIEAIKELNAKVEDLEDKLSDK